VNPTRDHASTLDLLQDPATFQLLVDALSRRYRDNKPSCIVASDLFGGAVLAAPVALALKLPLVLVRKAGELANAIAGTPFQNELGEQQALCIERGQPLHPEGPLDRSMLIRGGDEVVVIDAAVRTGESLGATVRLVQQLGGKVREVSVVLEVRRLKNQRERDWEESGAGEVPLFGLVSEDIIATTGEVPEGYQATDGKALEARRSVWARIGWGIAGFALGCLLYRRHGPALERAAAPALVRAAAAVAALGVGQ